jgi:hypothetical protein
MRNKKNLIIYFIFVIFYLSGCAPRVALPPLHIGEDLTLDEVISIAGRDIDTLKAVVDVTIKKKNKYYSSINASVLIKRPGLVHMRIYKFGMLVDDIVIRNNEVHVVSGKERAWLKHVGREFYHAIFWWDGTIDASMRKRGPEYIIRTEGMEMRLDNRSLFPLRQIIKINDRSAQITYSKPRMEGGRWFPSLIKIDMEDLSFSIKIEKLLLNPEPGYMDFKLPEEVRNLNQLPLHS